MKDLYIGCHLSSVDGFKKMGERAVSIGANTFAFFTRNPRGGRSKPADPDDAAALREILETNHFGPLVAHAPYTMNPCSKTKKTREFAELAMTEDLEKMEYLPGNYYNFHPGSHTGQGMEAGIQLITDLLNRVLKERQSTIVLLETMAGKGTEVGRDFGELAAILRGVHLKEKVGICLDTCHVYDGGYDIKKNLEGVLCNFDETIGLSYLKALHINDSKNSQGSHKDRHAKIGEGSIGTEAILQVITHPKVAGLPCILETPQENLGGYGKEIAMLREKAGQILRKESPGKET